MAWEVTVTDLSDESADAPVSHYVVATQADVRPLVESLVTSRRFADHERAYAVGYADTQLDWYPAEPYYLSVYTRLGERVAFMVEPDDCAVVIANDDDAFIEYEVLSDIDLNTLAED